MPVFRLAPFALALVALLFPSFAARADEVAVALRLDPAHVLARVPPDFLGFGCETSAVALPGYFNVDNRVLVRLYATLAPRGIIRVGGNVSDHARYEPDGAPAPNPEEKTTVFNRANLSDLGAFLRATGWQAIWGLNLGTGTKEEAAREALAVSEALGERLHSFQIGNEVDELPRFHQDYAAYLAAFRDYRAAILAVLPAATFSGPDVAWDTTWDTRFAHDEGKNILDLTAHYYRGGASQPAATLPALLARDDAWRHRTLLPLQALAAGQPFGYRLTEVNSFYGGGKPGVSDTFGSALWCLDYLLDCAAHGCRGVNLETDVNQHGWVSHYSPIFREEAANVLHARPEYYAMLAFAMTTPGNTLLETTLAPASPVNLTAYASRDASGHLFLILVNKDLATDAAVSFILPAGFTHAACERLQAPSAEDKDHTTFAGAAVAPDGRWTASPNPELLPSKNGQLTVHVPHAGAMVVRLHP